MPNLTNITLQLAHQSNTTTLYQNFEIQLDSNLLLELMTSYELKSSDVIGVYFFNSLVFDQFIKADPYKDGNSALNNTMQAILSWPQKLNWSQLNQQLNNLLLAWLNDYKLGANIDAAFLLARCLELKSSKNSQFQNLLLHLIARVTNQLDQYKYSYVQNFDLDTGLPNQYLLLNLLNLSLDSNQKSSLSKAKDSSDSEHLGLILVNLNVKYGEASQQNSATTNLMVAAIHIIQEHLNDDATLFHVGAIELAVLVNPLKSQTQLKLIATKLLHAFESELPLEEVSLIISPRIGAISNFNIKANAVFLYEYARLALNQAIVKNEPIKIYNQNIASSVTDSKLLDEAIIEALQQNELSLFLQPIVTINDKSSPDKVSAIEKCTSAEVLLRWSNHKWQSISPTRLLEVIYKKGFGRVFIRWLINNACQRCAELASTYQQDVSLTINLSSVDLLDSDLPELLSQSIKLWNIPAKNLTIEITENDILVDEVKVSQVLNQIIQLGCKLALDDFGTGYSSMARLRNMPINIVKIDQSFVRNISGSIQDKAIVKSIIKLAHSLGKEVIAEGVEDWTCLNVLKEMNCEKIQGYYYGKPMPFEDFIIWLNLFKAR